MLCDVQEAPKEETLQPVELSKPDPNSPKGG